MQPGKILIVDDRPDEMELFRQRLMREGNEVTIVTSRSEAQAQITGRDDLDVILLDIKLRGKDGPDEGLDLLRETILRAPFVKVIMMTGLAEEETVKLAFEAGAYDYLQKGPLFGALLSVKVRNAMEVARERRLGALEIGDREQKLRQAYAELPTEKHPQRKGKRLEELIMLLFKSIPGFEVVRSNVSGPAEEIDLAVRNQSTDPFWIQASSQHFLVECKNWSQRCEPKELNAFVGKLLLRGPRCRVGFFVAPGGFTTGFKHIADAHSGHGRLVVPIDKEALEALVMASDRDQRNERLKKLYEDAALHDRAGVGGA